MPNFINEVWYFMQLSLIDYRGNEGYTFCAAMDSARPASSTFNHYSGSVLDDPGRL